MFQKLLKNCPKCGETKPINTGFGWRRMPRATGPVIGPQSWCSKDRSSPVRIEHPTRGRR